MMPIYQELTNNNNVNLTARTEKTIYLNCILSCVILIIMFSIALSIIPLANNATILLSDAGQTLKDMNVIIPEVKDTLRMVYRLCQFENFTTHYGFLCDEN